MRIPVSSKLNIARMIALLLFCYALAIPRARAEVVISGLELDPHSGVEIKLLSTFKQLPQVGFATLQIYIRNDSGETRTWTFHFGSSGYPARFNSTREFIVPDKKEQTFEVLVPIATNTNSSYASSNIQIGASGYGITRESAGYSSSSSSGRTLTDYVLMSQALTVRSWGPLDKACNDKGSELQGCEFNPNYLPTDWRGYLGVGTLWITDSEWLGLDSIPRNAIREWIFQGGNLMICSTESHEAGDFGFHDDRPGYGQVRIVKWDGKELSPTQVLPLITSRDHALAISIGEGYQGRWDLAGDIGHMNLNSGFIVMFVICFGVVIGPLNFFWFAKSGNRHRLFWTVPLISIVGSVLLALVIVLQDGFGGTGNRLVLVQLIPGENEAVIAQEQISRTGLLLSSRFDAEDKAFVAPLLNIATDTGFQRGMGTRRESRSFTVNGHSYSSDWFISRTVQAQLIEATRPTRSRIEIIAAGNGEAPVLLSSIENNLHQVFFIDPDGHYWQAGEIRVGEKKTMQPSSEADFDKWMASNLQDAGERINFLAGRAMKRRGYFYAVADDAKGDAIATLNSIRWKSSKAIYLGPCAVGKNTAMQ